MNVVPTSDEVQHLNGVWAGKITELQELEAKMIPKFARTAVMGRDQELLYQIELKISEVEKAEDEFENAMTMYFSRSKT